MAGVIKGNLPGSNIVVKGKIQIDNTIKVPVPETGGYSESAPAEKKTDEPQPRAEETLRSAREMEFEQMKREFLDEANKKADEIVSIANSAAAKAREQAEKILSDAQRQAENIAAEALAEGERKCEEAKQTGYAEGYGEGTRKGESDGYLAGLKKCKDTLLELKSINEEIVSRKAELAQEYEHQLFDTIFNITQKITVNSLRQKDKAVIEKMLREAVKEFRGAKMIKVTLSQLDLSEDMNADIDRLREVFAEGTDVEFEVLKDAEAGTLIVDNGSEILDASVSTQLRMIEELGRGKYRDKRADKSEADITDTTADKADITEEHQKKPNDRSGFNDFTEVGEADIKKALSQADSIDENLRVRTEKREDYEVDTVREEPREEILSETNTAGTEENGGLASSFAAAQKIDIAAEKSLGLNDFVADAETEAPSLTLLDEPEENSGRRTVVMRTAETEPAGEDEDNNDDKLEDEIDIYDDTEGEEITFGEIFSEVSGEAAEENQDSEGTDNTDAPEQATPAEKLPETEEKAPKKPRAKKEKPAEDEKNSRKNRAKPTNPLLAKMLDNLGGAD